MSGTAAVYSCGQCEVDLVLRELRIAGEPVPLNNRAFAILALLVQSAGQLITKDDFKGDIWDGGYVSENALQVHISAIRKALGDNRGLLKTVSGRGYRLTSNWIVHEGTFKGPSIKPAPPSSPQSSMRSARESDGATQAAKETINTHSHNLPARPSRVLGRDADAQAIADQLLLKRFVTIVGPGGIGKTTIAVMTGHALLATFADAVYFVDLGAVRDPSLVAYIVATTLGTVIRTDNHIESITAFLQNRAILLILDSCEHVISNVAEMAEQIFRRAPQVSILATSRETLRVEGEHVYILAPLESPPDRRGLTAENALQFPAVQLFVERASAGGLPFQLTDAEAPVVAGICRALDGLALAIELAASRAATLGTDETARLVGSKLRLQLPGYVTTSPRHRTLADTLDWSHTLLTDNERAVLRRLSVFAGAFFGLEPVFFVCADAAMGHTRIAEAFDGLISKSLVAAELDRPSPHYRMLDTTRTYAQIKLADSGEQTRIAGLHATYFLKLLKLRQTATVEEPPDHAFFVNLNNYSNVRAALEWGFGGTEGRSIAVSLVAAAVPLFTRLSLLSECSHWTATAIAALDKRSRNTEIEMELQAALGQALMFTSGNGDRVREAFDRSLSIAERIGNYRYQVYILGWLHIFHLRLGENYAAHADANRCEAAAALAGNPAMIAAANAFIGASCFVMGKHRECQQHLDATLASGLPETVSPPLYFGYDYLSHAAICRARNLWVLGYANQAVDAAVRTIDDASYQPVTLSVALLYAGSIQLWNGDLVSARKTVDAFVEHSELHSLAPYYAAGLGLQGQIDIRSGQIDEGVRSLRNALRLLEEDRYGLWIVVFTTALAEGLFAMNEIEEGLLNIEKAIRRADSNGDLFAMPEILRIKAELLVASSGIEAAAAEALLTESLELANSRSALAWELRSATSLGTLWMKRGRHEDALQLLSSVYDRFADGLINSDLRAAAKMIEELRELLAPRPGSGPS